MKKIIFTLITLCAIYVQSNAQFGQYCGGSGPGECTPTGALSEPGLSPLPPDLAPVYVGDSVNVTIQFQNYDTVGFNGSTVTVDSLQIDTLSGLPPGLCWKTNKTNNTFGNKENGCINVSGVVDSSDACGQYRLYIIVNVWLSGFGSSSLTLSAASQGLNYYVRVKCSPSDTCPRLVDTLGQHANTNIFIPYTATCDSGGDYETGIRDINSISYLNTLSISPNPINTEATVRFNSTQSGKITEKITNILGSTIYSNELQLQSGQNVHTIQKGTLAPGVYIYTLTDGVANYSKKLVISE